MAFVAVWALVTIVLWVLAGRDYMRGIGDNEALSMQIAGAVIWPLILTLFAFAAVLTVSVYLGSLLMRLVRRWS